MDFSTPQLGTPQGNTQELVNQVSNLAPLATQWHGPTTGVAIGQIFNKPGAPKPTGFGQWIGNTIHEIGNIGSAAGKFIGHTLGTMATAPPRFGADLGHIGLDLWSMHTNSKDSQQLSGKLDNLMSLYKSGAISVKEYKLALNDLNSQFNDVIKENTRVDKNFKQDSKQTLLDGINVAADVVTILTAGFGAPVADASTAEAVRLLTSQGMDATMAPVVSKLGQLSVDKSLYEGLDKSASDAMQRTMAEIAQQGGAHMTAGNMARAAAVNLAFKYPLYFSWMSGTGADVYNKLADEKYGSATAQTAFNIALALSGGPFAWAIEKAGGAVKVLKDATFGRTAYIDELSKGIGNGDEAGLYKEITSPTNTSDYKFIENGKVVTKSESDISARLAANMSTNEKINLNAVKGGNPITAAWRVLNGQAAHLGTSMRDLSHHEALVDLNNHSEAFRYASDWGRRNGIANVAVGRVDARTLNQIAGVVADALPNGKQAALNAWEQLKMLNHTWAYTYNPNFDREIKALIEAHNSPDSLEAAIKDIKAGMAVKGVPRSVGETLAKLGYVMIKPTSLEAPFKEGVGSVATKFAQNENFFVKAVQPLPVLNHLGTMLTRMGLSPEAAVDRVYQIFNANLTDNMNRLGLTGKIARQLNEDAAASARKAESTTATQMGLTKEEVKMLEKQGVTPEMLAKGEIKGGEIPSGKPGAEGSKALQRTSQINDFVAKVLASYAKNPSRGKLARFAPITDYRMLSKDDIIKAFEDHNIRLNYADAADMQEAISHSYNQVPVYVRGLGDKAVDTAYRVPLVGKLFGKYLRLQGAVRFAWNPFFQYLRVVPKTEFLSAAEGGGWTHSVFAGRANQIGDIRQFLRDNGFLDKQGGFGRTVAGEAVDFAGVTGRNLQKALLPAQERSIAGLIDSQAQRAGMDWEEYIRAYPQQTRDTIQMIAEYDRRSAFLNSPMMRTLNIAFFPARFEVKVASILARNLSQASMMTQVGFVNGLFKVHQWLNSPEGMAWYSQNSDLLGLLKYISPVATMNEVFQSLLHGHDHSLGNFGELGGLPFGWIPQILNSEGVIQTNPVGVDPKTGALFETYVPATQRGQIAIAIQDFLGSIFSYPGATIGLPSKTGIVRSAALDITRGNKKTDLQLTTPQASDLSGQQQTYINTIQKASNLSASTPPQAVGPMPGSPEIKPGLSVPTLPTPATVPIPRRPGGSGSSSSRSRSGSAKSRKLKKAQFTPQLLPGQSSYGQL